MSKHLAFFSAVLSSISHSPKHRARRNSEDRRNSGQNDKLYNPLAQAETSNDEPKSAKSKSAKSKSAKSAKSAKSVRFAEHVESDKSDESVKPTPVRSSVPELRYRAKAAKAEHDKRRTIEAQQKSEQKKLEAEARLQAIMPYTKTYRNLIEKRMLKVIEWGHTNNRHEVGVDWMAFKKIGFVPVKDIKVDYAGVVFEICRRLKQDGIVSDYYADWMYDIGIDYNGKDKKLAVMWFYL